eukprot:PhF_6_TR5887/c0_g1_i1/m.8558
MARRATRIDTNSTAAARGGNIPTPPISSPNNFASTAPGLPGTSGLNGLTAMFASAGYGQSTAEKRTPQASKGAVVAYELFATDDYAESGQRYQNQFRRSAAREGFAKAMGDGSRSVDGAPHVWQMLIE